jgi:hypothetical protein
MNRHAACRTHLEALVTGFFAAACRAVFRDRILEYIIFNWKILHTEIQYQCILSTGVCVHTALRVRVHTRIYTFFYGTTT